MPRREAVTVFGVSLASLKRWLALRRAQQPLTPTVPPGRRRRIPPSQHAALWQHLEAHPDAAVEEHARRWNEHLGTAVSPWTVGRAIRRLGWTRKKRRWVPPSVTRSSAGSSASG